MESSYYNHATCTVYDQDLADQADLCLQAFFKAHAAAQSAVRLLSQETEFSSDKLLCLYEEDLEKVKFWTNYLLEKKSCDLLEKKAWSSSTDSV